MLRGSRRRAHDFRFYQNETAVGIRQWIFFDSTKPVGDVVSDEATLAGGDTVNSQSYFAMRTGITKLHLSNLNFTKNNANIFRGMTALTHFVAPKLTRIYNNSFIDDANLEVVDWLGGEIAGSASQFANCGKLATIIIRSSSVCSLATTAAFNSTPFKSGGTGGTIYIPKSLYDHLGDGTANDYKAATNWSTVNGYGTITWAKIEGSIYETQYADGTPIPTA